MDITIIGGGVIGLTLANLMANSDCKVMLLDQNQPPSSGLKTPYDLRVAAINHAAENIFRLCGIWDRITQLRISNYQKMVVWDENSPAKISFDCADVGKNYLGHIIEYNVLKQALYQQLRQHPNIRFEYAAKPVACQEIQNGIVLSLENGRLIHTQLLIGADGGNSWVAEHAGLSSTIKPYHHSALVTTLKTTHPHHNTARQRFLTSGPLAFLPLADPHLVSIVWSTAPGHANHLAHLSTPAFNQAVAQAFEHQLGDVECQDQRIVFPLTERHAQHYTKPRIALVGDAAHTLHPLAGQGMNLGLLDAACLAQTLIDAQQHRLDLGEFSVLRRYERWRKGENTLMIKLMSAFKHLFADPSPWLTHGRNLGLNITDNLPLVKNYLIERAMGLSGDLPQAALKSELI